MAHENGTEGCTTVATDGIQLAISIATVEQQSVLYHTPKHNKSAITMIHKKLRFH
jgi:hypothetical protein